MPPSMPSDSEGSTPAVACSRVSLSALDRFNRSALTAPSVLALRRQHGRPIATLPLAATRGKHNDVGADQPLCVRTKSA